MPRVTTKYFGDMDYAEESVFYFPFGLPAFEREKRFVFIESTAHAPLVFLQSASTAGLCFMALPIHMVDCGYELAVSPEDQRTLELDLTRRPQPAGETLALALVCLHDGFSATANLMAPILVNLRTRRALQAIRADTRYSHEYPVQALAAKKDHAC